jgi:hypothetical protein
MKGALAAIVVLTFLGMLVYNRFHPRPELVTPCVQNAEQTPAPVSTLGATELFNLRTTCAALGRELETHVGLPKKSSLRDTNSNYSVKENRCYVSIRDNFRGSDGFNAYYMLFDGQTRESLAYAIDKGGKMTGLTPGNVNESYIQAMKYIDKKMEREQ